MHYEPARRNIRCGICRTHHIRTGTDIVRYAQTTWATRECVEMQDRIRIARIELLQQHRIGFGAHGLPAGIKPTFSRLEWVTLAVTYGVVTQDEYVSIRHWWRSRFGSTLEIRDLSD